MSPPPLKLLVVGGSLLTCYLRDAGHEVAALASELPPNAGPLDFQTDFFGSPAAARDRLDSLMRDFRPDWILQVDDSTPLIHLGLERFDTPKAWYAVDSHIHEGWHLHYACLFDRVFCAQKNRVADLARFRPDVAWLPLYFASNPVFLPWEARVRDVAFVGTMDRALNPARCDLLDALRAAGLPLQCLQGDYYSVYRESKVVLNQSVRDDLNFRFFEAMGCGAVLLTDRLSHSLEEIGEPGSDFLVYEPGDAADCMAKAQWALSHPREAEAMARRGHARVLASHRFGHRITELVDVLRRGPRAASPRVDILAHLAYALQHAARLDLPAPLARHFAAEAGRLADEAWALAPGESWAALTTALLGLEAGSFAQGLERLGAVNSLPGEGEYRRSYLLARAMLSAHAGLFSEARRSAGDGLIEFPGDADFRKLLEVLLGNRKP